MAVLSASNLTKAFGDDTIFQGVSFEIQDHDRVGLVGCNGSGKTTLFRILTGDSRPDSGEVFQAKTTVIGYMEQHVCRDAQTSAYAEVLQVFSPLLDLEQKLEELQHALQSHHHTEEELHRLVEEQSRCNDQFVRDGGLTFRGRVRSALLGLGFSEEQIALPVMSLSGGQKAKLQLAKLLLCGANLLLLDEPTNHLDIASVEWLEDFLRGYPGAFLVISHDRYFLDRITNRTFEMEQGRMFLYKGNYSTSRQQREENRLSMQRKYDNTRREIDRIQGIVAQQRQWNRERNIRTAESKLKMIERLEAGLEKPGAEPESLHFQFGMANRGGNDVLSVEDLSVQFGGSPIFSHVRFALHRQQRACLIGPNGCGKTSLLKTILGKYPTASGSIRLGAGIHTGYYDQTQEDLSPEKTVLEEIWDAFPRLSQTEIRSALAVFLFRGEEVFKPISALSGGERARVLLLKLMLSEANFLLLDEPTNHLDIPSREALESALLEYEGTLLVISHDRYFMNRIADTIYTLSPKGIKAYTGNYDAYLEQSKDKKETAPSAGQPIKEKKENTYKKRKEEAAEKRKVQAALRRAEDTVERLEQQIQELEEQLCQPEIASDYEAALDLTRQAEALRAQHEEQMAVWEALCEQADTLEKES